MSSLPTVPLFVGGVELLLIGAVALVLIFGSKASDIARNAGSAAGKVRKTRATAEREIDDVRGELEESVEPVKEEAEAVETDVEEFEQEIDSATSDIAGSGQDEHGDTHATDE
ncbi:twin-arginine translocase TatA/TatE family subunit [Halovenus rubra]|uniref:Twin-arginine translocase TatA/TatE family subunit n=2 Tax=Halovenus rubra TaxID=869890 RepID=A0ABD5XCV5_9EURY|nr:hypothetical protein [Halovenus rubra]